ncbi:hypothetical protein BH11PSE3_BH11PSE3_04650 [soil metagenome]
MGAAAGDVLNFLKSGLLACGAVMLASCGALRDEAETSGVSVRGVQPTLEQLNITSGTAAQSLLVNDLIIKAGLTQTPAPGDTNWSVVAEAGIYEIGRQCDQYLDLLFRFNRNQRAVRTGLTATGAATATILGLAGIAAPPIAITAAAFGLSASLYDAGVNSVLFTIEPSALRNIVLKGRKSYLDNIDLAKVNSRPRMMIALQGYLSQCSPAAIEANVNQAASGAESVASASPAAAARAAALAAPASTLIERSSVVVSQRVGATPPVPVSSQPRNARPEEKNVTIRELEIAQAALGLSPDGNFGPNDGSNTRAALREFQSAMISRGEWPKEELTGSMAGQTYEWLRAMSPETSTPFLGPFERAYLGNITGALSARLSRPDPVLLDALLADSGVPKEVQQTASPDEKMKLLHARLQMLRKEQNVGLPKGIEPSKAQSGALDAALFDKLR